MMLMLAAAIAAASPAEKAWAACIDRTTTNNDWGRCGSAYIARADAALNAAWKPLIAAATAATRRDLLAEQRAWLAYRKTACGFYSNGDWGREGQVLHYPRCVAGVIKRRTKELQDYRGFIKGP